MDFFLYDTLAYVPESYSRQLDDRVALQEKPYGYMAIKCIIVMSQVMVCTKIR